MVTKKLQAFSASIVFALLVSACGGKENASSYQISTTVAENGSQASLDLTVEDESGANLFEGFSVEGDAPDPNAPQIEQAQQEVQSQTTAAPKPAETIPAVTSKPVPATTAKKEPATTVKPPSRSATFTNTSSTIRKIDAYNDPIITISINASCETGKEYILEAGVYENGRLLFVVDSESTCFSTIAHYRNTPFNYLSSANYTVVYKVFLDGEVIQERSAVPSIDL